MGRRGRTPFGELPRMSGMLGLPNGIRAGLFDLDGVLTQTARLHAAAWKDMFDAFLRGRAEKTGGAFAPFDPVVDYAEFIDGKLRSDGVRSFLSSRDIDLLEGDASDPPGAETIRGLGDRKNKLVLTLIRREGVETYPGSVRYVRAAREAGIRRAVVSASRNCHEILLAAGIDDLFEEVIDGIVAEREHLGGKPAPDTFLVASDALGVPPGRRCGVRGCAGRSRGGASRRLRLRRRREQIRPGERSPGARCGHGRL